MSVLVLDANSNAAMAIIRSLGRKGIKVIAADFFPRALGLKSRYAKETFCYPDPLENVSLFLKFMQQKLKELSVELIIPTTDRTMAPMVKNRNIIPEGVILAAPENGSFQIAQDKIKTYNLARDCGIPVPRAIFMGKYDEFLRHSYEISYPVVVKPAQSKNWVNDKGCSLSVSYANNRDELISLLKQYSYAGEVIVQEYVQAGGCGIEILADRGEVLLAFQHNRLREVPISGGASSLRESAPLNRELFNYTKKLINKLHWTGVIMAEFKYNQEQKKAYLIELNGRFWGSLNLAIASGIDFPYYLYLLLVKKEKHYLNEYKIGVKAKAITKDIEWVESALRKSDQLENMQFPSRGQALKAMSRLFEANMCYDFQSWDDPMPGIYELISIANSYLLRLGNLARKRQHAQKVSGT